MNNTLPFVKMHGLGNDYVYIDGFRHAVADPAALARAVSPRHTGVGSDGLILLIPAEPESGAHLRMRMYNADGSASDMCGNGLRCVTKMAVEHGISAEHPMRIAAGEKVVSVSYERDAEGIVRSVTVDLGSPRFNPSEVPWIPEQAAALAASARRFGCEVSAEEIGRSILSMGNPHLVLFVSNVDAIALHEAGPVLEHHPAFPERVNIHIVECHSRGHLRMRTWERGSGLTMACGSGAAAVCVIAAETGRAERACAIDLPGGRLDLHWSSETGSVLKTGPATEVFRGLWPLS